MDEAEERRALGRWWSLPPLPEMMLPPVRPAPSAPLAITAITSKLITSNFTAFFIVDIAANTENPRELIFWKRKKEGGPTYVGASLLPYLYFGGPLYNSLVTRHFSLSFYLFI
ncbi:hypothetical protein L6164_036058 [Bauhinia variegata]|uniref:Uncharacterized protein n=1 Tax=Bauhinia variegata TaxID=167791 RepID=A0ACB9KFU8_BAUVA|nr:hypothetical protein L6164_036058 [Bauhinia variegata]